MISSPNRWEELTGTLRPLQNVLLSILQNHLKLLNRKRRESSSKRGTGKSGKSEALFKQSSNELGWIEILKVIHAFSYAYKPDRNAEFFLYCEDYAAFCCSVQFCQGNTGDSYRLIENVGLPERILSCCRIYYEENFLWGIGHCFLYNTVYFFQLVHKLAFRMEPSSSIDYRHIGPACLCCFNSIESDRGRV